MSNSLILCISLSSLQLYSLIDPFSFYTKSLTHSPIFFSLNLFFLSLSPSLCLYAYYFITSSWPLSLSTHNHTLFFLFPIYFCLNLFFFILSFSHCAFTFPYPPLNAPLFLSTHNFSFSFSLRHWFVHYSLAYVNKLFMHSLSCQFDPH